MTHVITRTATIGTSCAQQMMVHQTNHRQTLGAAVLVLPGAGLSCDQAAAGCSSKRVLTHSRYYAAGATAAHACKGLNTIFDTICIDTLAADTHCDAPRATARHDLIMMMESSAHQCSLSSWTRQRTGPAQLTCHHSCAAQLGV
jgi:hypothetical protein